MERIDLVLSSAPAQFEVYRRPYSQAIQTSAHTFTTAFQELPFEDQEAFLRARAGFMFRSFAQKPDKRIEALFSNLKHTIQPQFPNHDVALNLHALDSYAKRRVSALVVADTMSGGTGHLAQVASVIDEEVAAVAYRTACFAKLKTSDVIALIRDATLRMEEGLTDDMVWHGLMKLGLGYRLLA